MIPRDLLPVVEERLFEGRVLVVYGARQVGKRTLVKELLARFEGPSAYLSCDEPDVRLALERRTSTELKRFARFRSRSWARCWGWTR